MRTVAVPRAQPSSPRQAETPQKQSEETAAKEEPAGASEEPKEEAEAPSLQKTAPPSKTSKVSTAAKPSASSSKKGSSTNLKKGSSAKTTQGKAKESASKYDQKLLGEALRRLDRSKFAAACGSGSGSGSGGGSSTVAHVGAVGALNVESGVAMAGTDAGEACEGYVSASPEACYIGDLIRRLQLNVRLPEPGEVRVQLTLKRNGAIASVEVLSGSKASIKQTIEKKLKAVHFSPFGMGFSNESEHTFNLRLSNDLIWSCGR